MTSSLRARLRLGLACLAFGLALLAVGSVMSLRRVRGVVEVLLRENYPSILACGEMSEALEREDSAAFFRMSGREHVGFGTVEAQRRAFDAALERAQGSVALPGEGELVDRIRKLHGDYAAVVDAALAAPPSDRLPSYFRDVVPRFDRLKEGILELRRMNVAILERADRDAQAVARTSLHEGAALAVLAAAFAAWAAFWLGRSIVRPVDAFVRTASSIGELDLDVLVPEPEVRELAPLAASFRSMLERLRAYRDRSQGELRAAQDLANATVECMLDPVFVFDDQGRILLANQAANDAFGGGDIPRGEDLPKELLAARDRVLVADVPVLPKTLAEAMRRNTGDGERYYLVRAAPLRHSPSAPRAVLVVAQDVTRFRRIDELKSDVVATVSHEFKTPLTSLRMATHLLLDAESGPLTDTQREIVTTARDDTERLRALVDELLDLVRIENEAGALRLVAVDPASVLRSVAASHRTVAREKNVTIDVSDDAVPTVAADPERLTIVVANLVANAIRHTPPFGRVSLSARAADGVVRLEVEDTGEGIGHEDLPRVFERSVRGRSNGHGLGLSIAREIVHEHGGELEVRSVVGKGSTFTVVLPRTAS